jgi:hypothetical protein
MIDYLCVIFGGDGVKRRPQRLIREHIDLEMITGERIGN